jgi:hypothetical protein
MNKILYFSLIVLCLGCKHKYNTVGTDIDSIKIYSIDPGNAKKIYASEVFDSIAYIPLESSNDDALIGHITKVEIRGSLIYLLDAQTSTIWCFDYKGRYVSKIHKIGQGTEEYVSIYDFTVDHTGNFILILDRTMRKIIWFTTSGKFVKNMRIPVAASNFGLFKNNKILAYTRGVDIFMNHGNEFLGYNCFVIDSAGKSYAYFPYKDETDNLIKEKTIEFNDNKFLINYASNDTIYEFDEIGNLVKKHVIDFGNYRIPTGKVSGEQQISFRNNPKYASLDNVYYSNNYSIVTYSFEKRVRFTLRNNKTGKSIIGSFLENDMDFISLANPTPIRLQDNRIYYLKDADFIMKQKHDKIPAYINIPSLSYLKEDDNPVLMIGYLKF